MKAQSKAIKKILACLLSGIVVIAQPIVTFAGETPAATVSELTDIDEGIFNLQYNKQDILSTKGDQIESFIPKQGILNGDRFIVVERNKKSLQTTPVDISIIDSMVDRTYPGALQLADDDFVNNQPNLLTSKRKPLKISIDLPGMKKENTIQVENPTYGNVKGSIDELIAQWSEKYSQTHSLPARIQYSEAMVHSESQLASALNINVNAIKHPLGIDFESVSNGDKKSMVAVYKQIFYTVSAENPNQPSDLFDEDVTFQELRRKGVSDETPPTMVSNVAYGRTIYVKLETTSKSDEVQAAFSALLSGNGAATEAKYKEILEESSFTAVVLGGDANAHNKIITKDFDDIQSVIQDNAEFSLKNPAYPISYTSVFLKDNSVAAIQNHTEYIETKATEHKSGKININHRGGYVAQFNINWDEVSYDEEGNEVLRPKSWNENWKDKTAPFTSVLYIPPNATNIRIYAREATGLAWDWWRTVIDERHVPLSREMNIKLSGTTLNPKGSIDYK